jgi:N-acetylglucosaminyldiphosphoundecaprenol N-acetyl-beta-D-mannosaminyltransferase
LNFIDRNLYLKSMTELIKIIELNTLRKIKKNYFAINSDCMLTYWSNQEYKQIVNDKNAVVYVDGMGVIYAQKILGLERASERIATTDLFPKLLNYLNSKDSNIKIYLLGGKCGTAEKVKEKFTKKYPNINIVGTHHGYFDDSEKVIKQINDLNTDILFVGFGTPIQEQWVNKYYDKLQVSTIITCGGLFDYYADNVKRAPLFMQKSGLEWLFRLIQEPKRLWKRYIIGNFIYITKVFFLMLLNKSTGRNK